jgi:heme-binding NEAT domain protein
MVSYWVSVSDFRQTVTEIKHGDRIMNMNLDELGKKLHGKIDNGINHLKTAKDHLENVKMEAETAIQTNLKAAKETLEEKKQETADATARLKELVEDKKTETETAVAEWKSNRDLKKLEKRAERAEKYAEACVEMALSSVVEAEVAILEAVAARQDADNAA